MTKHKVFWRGEMRGLISGSTPEAGEGIEVPLSKRHKLRDKLYDSVVTVDNLSAQGTQ